MKQKIAGLSVFANFILAMGKILVGTISGSASILAEGIHSGTDILSSAIGFIGIKLSKKPVDKKHPYGYYKAEVLSGAIITLILFLTGCWIIYDSYQSFLNPSKLTMGYITLGIMGFSAVTNEIMARLKIHYGKKENSISLVSDGVHSRIDVFISIAVLIGLILNNYWIYIDSVLALFVGLFIIKESFSLGKEATDSLLDVSAPEKIEEKIRKIAKQNKIKISELKTQKKGSAITANLEIKLPSTLKVQEATKISNNLKGDLVRNIDNLEYVGIQIKSHDVTDSYFKPTEFFTKIGFGRGFGWRKKGRFKGEIKQAKGKGPKGYCVCPKCNYKIKHKRGMPCSTIKCPKCNAYLERK